MARGYFERLLRTSTRVWINNPTLADLERALEQGAVACTTNPGYSGTLLTRAPGEIEPLIKEVVRHEPDDGIAAEIIQRRLVSRILPRFRPEHERSGGRDGWVSLQGPPLDDVDPSAIEASARAARALGVNCIPKIPATAAGLQAFATLANEGHPALMTEVFSLAQVAATCEVYERSTRSLAQRPAFIMAPITGIFGDHLRAVAASDGDAVEPTAFEWAGVAFARAAARMVAEREYPVTLLFGGARSMLDLTGLVGSRHQATVNWSTFDEVLAADPPCVPSIDDPVPAEALDQLACFDSFRRAMLPHGLTVDEFESFGPVQHFRNNFIAGWQALLAAVGAVRLAASAGVPA
jgi:transaldolase